MSDEAAKQDAPLTGEELRRRTAGLQPGWTVVDDRRLEKEYRFKDFREALDFVNRLGEAAEAQGHHPDVFLAWGKVKVTLWTHSAGGVTPADLTLAAEADRRA
jgi:4a-hydroxytetrahydrobiopterin dehydratase